MRLTAPRITPCLWFDTQAEEAANTYVAIFNEAVSFQVHCETQEEIDYYWGKLTEHGEEGPCGWLKDRYGLSWQIVPAVLPDMLMDPDPEKSGRVTKAFLQMKKFDIAALERAYKG